MHEMSVMAEIFSLLDKKINQYNLTKVTKIVVRIGELTCINDSALRFAYDVLKEKGIAEKADFVIKKVPARARCRKCNRVFKINVTDKCCPDCGQYSNDIVSGYELLLDSVEGEIDENNSNKGKNTG